MARSLLALLTVSTAAISHVAATAEPRVVRMPMHRVASSEPPLRKRATGPQEVTLVNAASFYLYYVNATIGSPPQTVSLQIDTGSSDIWMFGPQVCDQEQELCDVGGYYDPSQSDSFNQLDNLGTFKIQYVTPGSGVRGEYFSDDFQIGDIKLTDLTMALATSASAVNTGIMGIGYDTDESITSSRKPYPNLIDVMVNESVIASRSYSLYLDDREASTGSILFGGYDTTKYTPPLTVLDIQPMSIPGSTTSTITSFTVAWSFLGVSVGSGGGTTLLQNSDFPMPAVLDSGTSLTVIPKDIFDQLANYFNATYAGQQYGYLVPCSNGDIDGALDFGFGGSDGAVIQVPFSELTLPASDEYGDPIRFNDGTLACSFGLDVVSQDSPILLGDTFLRSAYVIYDIDANQIAIAQAQYNATASPNYKEIASGSNLASILGSAATVATGAAATQSASINLPNGIGDHTASASIVPTESASGSGDDSASITGVQTTLHVATTLNGHSSPTGGDNAAATSSGAASPLALPQMQDLSLWFATGFALFASGAAMMMCF